MKLYYFFSAVCIYDQCKQNKDCVLLDPTSEEAHSRTQVFAAFDFSILQATAIFNAEMLLKHLLILFKFAMNQSL